MPELPEVHTTSSVLNKLITGKTIRKVWTDYGGDYHKGKSHIKDRSFFLKFKKAVKDKKILKVHRIGKNVLIDISDGLTILIHMKMTGHILYGKYAFSKGKWLAKEKGPLQDPYNQFIHFVLLLSDGKSLALSDVRKFAKVTLLDSKNLKKSTDLISLGPDPTSTKFDFESFKARIYRKPLSKIKTALMDQSLIAGIGNIYSDEILCAANIHPLSTTSAIPKDKLREVYKAMKKLLKKGVSLGGDSMSDYRNPYGGKGNFQEHHKVYKRAGKKCKKNHCDGIIKRMVIGGRSSHLCPTHQRLYK